MSIGLLVKDANGRAILDPSTFTVRLVTTVRLTGGASAEVRSFPVPAAKAGMFAVAAPASQLATDAVYTGRYERQGTFIGTDIPAVEVVDGAVRLYPPMSGGTYMLDVLVYVFTNI
jgi:hypothetical protein